MQWKLPCLKICFLDAVLIDNITLVCFLGMKFYKKSYIWTRFIHIHIFGSVGLRFIEWQRPDLSRRVFRQGPARTKGASLRPGVNWDDCGPQSGPIQRGPVFIAASKSTGPYVGVIVAKKYLDFDETLTSYLFK